MEDIMNSNELHAYGIRLIESYLKKEGYTIIETNKDISADPQIIAQKTSKMIFVIVRTAMYPKKEKDMNISKNQLALVKQGANTYGAECYVAKVGLANAKGQNEKELGIPYKNADFLVKFNGLKKV